VSIDTWSGRIRQILLKILMKASRAIWFVERFIPVRGGRRLAPAMVCAARSGSGVA